MLLKIFKALSVFPFLQRMILRIMNTGFLVGIVGLIIDDKKRVVLFHHTYRNRYPWGLPGGWMKKGEQPAAALIREIKEESGLDIIVKGPFEVRSEKVLPFVEIVMMCRLKGGRFQPSDEVDKLIHCTKETIPKRIKDSQRRIVEEFFQTGADQNDRAK